MRTIIKLMGVIDELVDEQKQFIETIEDLKTRAAAHTQAPQPAPINTVDCPFCNGQGFYRSRGTESGREECAYCSGTGKKFAVENNSLLSELCAVLGWQGGTRAEALERVRELNSIANRCAQDVNYHATPKPREFTERGEQLDD